MRKLPPLDPFSRQRMPEIARRWSDLQTLHRQQQRLLWTAMIATEFADDELQIIDQVGMMCDQDVIDLAGVGRYPIDHWPYSGKPFGPGQPSPPTISFGDVS